MNWFYLCMRVLELLLLLFIEEIHLLIIVKPWSNELVV